MERTFIVKITDPEPESITAAEVAMAVGSRYKIVAKSITATETT